MSPKLPVVSGLECIRALEKRVIKESGKKVVTLGLKI